MGTQNTPFQVRPVTFNRISVMDAVFPLIGVVMNSAMIVSQFRKDSIRHHFIGADSRAFLYVFSNDRQQRFPFNVVDNSSHNITVTLKHTENAGFLGIFRSRTTDKFLSSTNIRFINLYMTGKAIVTVNDSHVFTDFMADTPRTFISHAQLPLEFFSRDSMTSCGKQVHGIEPLLQRGTGFLEWGTDLWTDLIGTPLALINRAFAMTAKRAVLSTIRTVLFLPMTYTHQVIQTAIVIGKAFKKFSNSKVLSHVSLQYCNTSKIVYRSQGDKGRTSKEKVPRVRAREPD